MRPLPRFLPRLIAALCFSLAAFAAAPAYAQITITANSSAAIYTFGLSACEGGTSVTFSYDDSASTFAGVATLSLLATPNSDCTADATNPVTFTVADQTATSGSVAVPVSDFLFGTACTASTTTSANPGVAYFCATLEENGTVEQTGSIAVNFAMQPPGPPIGIVVASGDEQLHVSWTPADASDTIATYQVYCEPDGEDFDSTKYSNQVSSSVTATVSVLSIERTPLVNGDSYSIELSATDTYGNTSALSDPVAGNVPEPVADFYEYYQDAGGSALGGHGCESGAGAAWLALICAGAWLALRARRARIARASGAALGAGIIGILGLALLAFPRAARADDDEYSVGPYQSQQRADRVFFFALEADRYTPQIDSETDLNGATPYRDIFGHRIPWRVQGEFAWEAVHFRDFGAFLVGGSVGFWQNIGKGIYAAGPLAGQPSSDTTLLDIWPFGVEAQWRFDVLADRFRWFPIIPYAKIGLMAALWTVYAGNGEVAHTSTGRGSGWTEGYTASLGAAVSLDAIDPGISNEAYLDLGLQRTSLFVEYGWTQLDSFQSPGTLILSDRAWRFGLSLEF